MAAFLKKRFEKPDETKSLPKTRIDIVKISDQVMMKQTFAPGWKWSIDIKPLDHTDSCQKHHVGYCLSGHMAGKLDDGTKWEYGPGDVIDIPPGHDGWVVGNEPSVLLLFAGTSTPK